MMVVSLLMLKNINLADKSYEKVMEKDWDIWSELFYP